MNVPLQGQCRTRTGFSLCSISTQGKPSIFISCNENGFFPDGNNVLFTLNCTKRSSILLLCVVRFNMSKTLLHREKRVFVTGMGSQCSYIILAFKTGFFMSKFWIESAVRVALWAISTTQKLRFGLVLDRLAVLKQNGQLRARGFFHVLTVKKKSRFVNFNTVAWVYPSTFLKCQFNMLWYYSKDDLARLLH